MYTYFSFCCCFNNLTETFKLLQRNVVRTYGVIIDNSQQTFWIVMEYLAGSLGSLYLIIGFFFILVFSSTELCADKIVGNPENHAQLTEEEMIGFARDIAHGMAHLASCASLQFLCNHFCYIKHLANFTF